MEDLLIAGIALVSVVVIVAFITVVVAVAFVLNDSKEIQITDKELAEKGYNILHKEEL